MGQNEFKDIGEVRRALDQIAADADAPQDATILVSAMRKMAEEMENCQKMMSQCQADMRECQTQMGECQQQMRDCQKQMNK